MLGDATLRAEARALMDELLDAARRLGHAVIRHVAERSVCSRGFPAPAIALLKIAGSGKSRLRNSGRALHGA